MVLAFFNIKLTPHSISHIAIALYPSDAESSGFQLDGGQPSLAPCCCHAGLLSHEADFPALCEFLAPSHSASWSLTGPGMRWGAVSLCLGKKPMNSASPPRPANPVCLHSPLSSHVAAYRTLRLELVGQTFKSKGSKGSIKNSLSHA